MADSGCATSLPSSFAAVGRPDKPRGRLNRGAGWVVSALLWVGVLQAATVQTGFTTSEVARREREGWGRQQVLEELTPFHDWGEFLLDTSITRVGAWGDQESPAVSSYAAGVLVVWQSEQSGQYDVCAARVSSDGEVMDSSGITIAAGVGDQCCPAVACDGAGFLVVWQDERGGSDDIYGARIAQDGTVLDPEGLPISTAAGDQSFPAVAFGDSVFLVVWQDERGSYSDIYGARVSSSGEVLDPADIAISTAPEDQCCPAVAYDGASFGVVWQDERGASCDIYGARVSEAGVVQEPAGIAVSSATDDQRSPRVAAGDTHLLVVWQDGRSGERDEVYAARLARTGEVLDPLGAAVSSSPYGGCCPAVAFDGTSFAVVWQDWRWGESGDIYAARVSEAGTVLDPSGIAVSRAESDQDAPSVARAGFGVFAVWQDGRSGSSCDIYAARLNAEGVVQDTSGIMLTAVVNEQWFPAVASDGSDFFVVWQDARGRGYDIYGARVTQAGIVLDPAGICVCGTASLQHDPALAFDGENYLVVWEDSRTGGRNDIYGTRVTKAGVVLDMPGIAICTAPSDQWEPVAVFGDSTFLVVWHEYRNGPGSDIYGARVTKTGTVLDPSGIPICIAARPQRYAAAAFDGTNYLVVWQHEGENYDIHGTRVTTGGRVLDPSGFAVCTADDEQRYPVVAFDGTNYFVAWSDRRNGSSYGIYGARVDKMGAVLDSAGIVLCSTDCDPWYPALEFDGAGHLAVWTHRRTGSPSDICGARVTLGGSVIEAFPVVTQEGNQWSGTLGTANRTQTLLAYTGWAGTVTGRRYSSYRIWGKLGPFPGVEASPSALTPKTRTEATIIRGELLLDAVAGRPHSACATGLLDIGGRKILDLHPGANDVRSLAPGVYFYREPSANGGERCTVSRIIITR